MSVIAAAAVCSVLDELTAWWVRSLGAVGTETGLGSTAQTWGASHAALDLATAIAGIDDLEPSLDLGRSVLTLQENTTAAKIALLKVLPVFNALDRHCQKRAAIAAVVSFDTYLTYLNCTHATKWQTLAESKFRDLYYACKGVYPSVNNVYQEVLQGSAYANGLRKLIVGTSQTAGATIDSAKYCGGFPTIIVSNITGSGVVTVTGSQYNPATKTVTAGKTWTVTASGNTTYTLVPGGATAADTDSLIVAVSDISAAAGITVGTIYAQATRPSGRTIPA